MARAGVVLLALLFGLMLLGEVVAHLWLAVLVVVVAVVAGRFLGDRHV